MVKPIQVVVTGASGFVAKNLRKYLSENDVNLISISRNNFRTYKNEQKIISKDYKEKFILNKIKNSNALIHLVGIGKQSVEIDYEMINVELTKHIVNLAKKAKIKKIVYNSGLGVSSKTSVGYFISKYKAEKIIVNSGLNYTIFRPSYIVGKDDLFTKFLKKQIKIKTIEGMATNGKLHPIQESFREKHGLQCGFCTPGMIMSSWQLLERNPNPSEDEIRHALEGNFCRCTGYHNIVNAVQDAATKA